MASATARLQIEQSVPVTNLYHQRLNVDKGVMRLLPHLDGRHDRQALIQVLVALTDEGIIEVSQDEQPVTDPEFIHAALLEVLDMLLKQIAMVGLLVHE
jgi:methyltransferase-like protein